MTQAAAQAAAFFAEVAKEGAVWTVRDEGGYPAPMNGDGIRSQPFWSRESRARKIVDTVPAYGMFAVVEISLEEFETRWLPGMEKDGLHIGVNWSGPRALGYDLAPKEVATRLNYERDKATS